MSCCGCSFLDESKKLDGKVDGCKYFCKKKKAYVKGNDDGCTDFKECFRSNDKRNDIYTEGKKFYDDDHSVGYYFIILVILIIVIIIARFCNPTLFPF